MVRSLLVFAVSLALASISPAVAQPGGPIGGHEAGTTELNPLAVEVQPLRATLNWTVEPRYDGSWDAYDPSTASYDVNYVQAPGGVAVSFDTCGSTGANSPIVERTVSVRSKISAGINTTASLPQGQCRLQMLLRPMDYEVEVAITTEAGDLTSQIFQVPVRDYLIVSLGDSLSSGEGVPDGPAVVDSYDLPSGLLTFDVSCREIDDGNYDSGDAGLHYNAVTNMLFNKSQKWNLEHSESATWADRRCHRSRLSAPALAAKALEDGDPHSSVTFVSLACSGAGLREGALESYGGMEPASDDTPDLQPQIELMGEIVGQRRVDALLLSLGMNDIGFSDIIYALAKDGSSITSAGNTFASGYLQLPDDFELLQDRIEQMEVSEVYSFLYPEEPFSTSGGGSRTCNLFETRYAGVGIDGDEVDAIKSFGTQLNFTLSSIANRMNWNVIDGRHAYDGHGYCVGASERRITRLNESCELMARRDGMLHPNYRGHEHLADVFVDAIKLGAPPSPSHLVEFTVRSVTILDPIVSTATDEVVKVSLDTGGAMGPDTRSLAAIRNQTVPVTEEQGEFRLNVYPAPTLPRLPTGASVIVLGQLPAAEQAAIIDPPPGDDDDVPLPPRPRYFHGHLTMTPENGFGETDGSVLVIPIDGGGEVRVEYEIEATPQLFPETAGDPNALGNVLAPL